MNKQELIILVLMAVSIITSTIIYLSYIYKEKLVEIIEDHDEIEKKEKIKSELDNIKKKTELIIIILMAISIIASAVIYISYKLRENNGPANKMMPQPDIEKKREERYSEYKMVSQITEDFFEKNLTSTELDNRKKIISKDIVDMEYYLYVRLSDLTQENDHRIASFYEAVPYLENSIPVRYVFYDDEKLIKDSIKRKSYLDIKAKAFKAENSTVYKDYIDVFLNITNLYKVYNEDGNEIDFRNRGTMPEPVIKTEPVVKSREPPPEVKQEEDSVLVEAQEWRKRPLETSYAIAYLDSFQVRGMEDGKTFIKRIYLALGVDFEGQREVLGFWIEENEETSDKSAFYMEILKELKNRGIKDILITCFDKLSGYPEALREIYPDTSLIINIFYLLHDSTKFVSDEDVKKVSSDLEMIFFSPTKKSGRAALERFKKTWDDKYPMIYPLWDDQWDKLDDFFKYPIEIRKLIYMTNEIESLIYQAQKVFKNRSAFLMDDDIYKNIYLEIQKASKKWTTPVKNWGPALYQFYNEFGEERVPLY